MKLSLLFPVMAAMLGLSGLLHAADSEADVLWKKVDDALSAMNTRPATPPKSREEAMDRFKKLITTADDAAKAFVEKFPNDARRWKIRLFDGMTAQIRESIGVPTKGDMKTALDEIVKSTDADPETKSEASAIIVLSGADGIEKGQVTSEEWTKLAEAHLKTYPDSKRNKIIQNKMERMKTLADLKSKPLDIKFTAVDGREVDLSKMNGKVVLIDFWATWCGPCVAEVPNVVKTYEKLHGKGFEIIGISLDKDNDKGKLESFTKEKNMTWAQYFDGKGWENDISTRYGIKSIPAMWLVNKKGMVVSTNARGNLEAEVEKLLAE